MGFSSDGFGWVNVSAPGYECTFMNALLLPLLPRLSCGCFLLAHRPLTIFPEVSVLHQSGGATACEQPVLHEARGLLYSVVGNQWRLYEK